jgi:hypothetical protein
MGVMLSHPIHDSDFQQENGARISAAADPRSRAGFTRFDLFTPPLAYPYARSSKKGARRGDLCG